MAIIRGLMGKRNTPFNQSEALNLILQTAVKLLLDLICKDFICALKLFSAPLLSDSVKGTFHLLTIIYFRRNVCLEIPCII